MTEWMLYVGGEPAERRPSGEVLDPGQASQYRLRSVAGDEILVPPLDELDIYGNLPSIPDATVTVHYEVTGTPAGTIRVVLDIVEGRMASANHVASFGPVVEPQVFVSIPWPRHLAWRAARCSLLEALDGSRIEGRWQTLLLVHGLLQQPAWLDALRARPPVDPGHWQPT